MSLDFSPDYCTHCNNTGIIEGKEPCPFCERAMGYEPTTDDEPLNTD